MHYGAEVSATFPGERLSVRSKHGATRARCPHFTNSGCAAVALAVARGARRVVLLGYDCQLTGGKTHWHGNHGGNLGNAGTLANWPGLFVQLAAHCARHRVQVVNATRETALTCFPRQSLEDALT
jgi:hypothetical protein